MARPSSEFASLLKMCLYSGGPGNGSFIPKKRELSKYLYNFGLLSGFLLH
jgi:hypothetical protein